MSVSPNLRIAWRFLTARKRSMAMSLAGIVFGVGFFIVTQAQTSGFEAFFIRTVLGTDGALRVEDKFQPTMFSMDVGGDGDADKGVQVRSEGGRKFVSGVVEPEAVKAAVKRFANVSGAAIVVEGAVTAEGPVRQATGRALGIDPEDYLNVSALGRQIVRGELETFRMQPASVLVGIRLADTLGADVGDSLVLAAGGQHRRYRIAGLFETGVGDIDKNRFYLNLAEARSLFRRPTGASYIQVSLFDPERAREDALRMQDTVWHVVRPWQERERTWLGVFQALRVSSAITVSTIILISGLGMFNTLAMMVVEKTREIAILRALGHTRSDVARIFLLQGLIVLAGGTVLGCGLGAAATLAVSKIPLRIRGIFATDSFVVAWSPWHYAAAAVTAAVVVLLASLVPARRAARLEPGEVMRGGAS